MIRRLETFTPGWADYELVDTGAGKKLERFGEFFLIRPEPQAKWSAALPARRWDAADGEFVKARRGKQGRWKFRKPVPEQWMMRREGLKFWVRPAPSGHVGVFPDQACHWDWIGEVTSHAAAGPVKMLSLFGHTGLATLSAAAAGAEVTHVDASQKAVAWARENQRLSEFASRPIRWIVEDALRFVSREVRRGSRYDALLLDPPRFGRGPNGEIWKLEESLPELLDACRKILTPAPVWVVLNVYVTVLMQGQVAKEAEALRSCLKQMLKQCRLTITAGALILQDAGGRRISASVFARAR